MMMDALAAVAILSTVFALCWFATNPHLWRKLRPFGFLLVGIAAYLAIMAGWLLVPAMAGAAFVYGPFLGFFTLVIVLYFCSGRRA